MFYYYDHVTIMNNENEEHTLIKIFWVEISGQETKKLVGVALL